jgi:predicted neuraminidase
MRPWFLSTVGLAAMPALSPLLAQTSIPGLVRSEFIFEPGAIPSVHASTIAELKGGLIAAWFGGTHEGNRDVVIWASRRLDGFWSPPYQIADGVQADGTRYPCWNPVLFAHSDSLLMLFYKVGPEPQLWWGMAKSSRDGGRTWSPATGLPDGVLGPIKNKPVRLADGTIISGSSTESHEANSKWHIHFELSSDDGRTWSVVRPAPAPTEIDAIQPSILVHSRTRLQAIGRTRQGRVFETWSEDGGRTWSPVALIQGLANPNAGTDAITLSDGRHLLVHNNTTSARTPLNVSVSLDGRRWRVYTVESDSGEYSYPAVIQTRDGYVHITYTWRREQIRHVVLDPRELDPSH